MEKKVLNRIETHPNIIRMYHTFQDVDNLYYLLEICTGGELWVCIYMYMYMYIYVCMCICMYMYIYMYIYADRHTHTHIHIHMHTTGLLQDAAELFCVREKIPDDFCGDAIYDEARRDFGLGTRVLADEGIRIALGFGEERVFYPTVAQLQVCIYVFL